MKVTILKSVISVALTFGVLLVFTIPAHAQNRSIRVRVTDENNQPVQDVMVRIEGLDVHRVFEGPRAKTDRRGELVQLLGTQAATYRVVVRKEGFQPDFKDNIRPEYGEEFLVEFQIKPGTGMLAFEVTDADRAKQQQIMEEQQRQQRFSAEVRAHFDQGVTLFAAGQYNDALKEFSAALAIDPKQPGILSRIGDSYASLDRNKEALEAYDGAIELSPNDANLYAQRGVVLSRLGKASESQESFKRSAELDPSGAAMNFYNLGVTLVNAGDMGKAVEAFKQSIEADPNYAESYYLLGISLVNDESMFSAAIDAFKKYLEIGKRADQVQIAKDMIDALGNL